MKVIDPGHRYDLRHLDGEGIDELVFVKRIGPEYPGNEAPPHEGTTVEEVLRVCIDRLAYVGAQQPCRETSRAKAHLKLALFELESRVRRVRGQPDLPLGIEQEIHALPACARCGHILCITHRTRAGTPR